MKKTCLINLLVLATFCSALGANAQTASTPWPMFRHDLQHTGRSPYSGPSVPMQKWCFASEDGIFTSAVIGSDGTIYEVSDSDLYAFAPGGGQRWAFNMGTDGIPCTSPAIGSDGTIYLGSDYGEPGDGEDLNAMNRNGTPKWTFGGGDDDGSCPAIGADGTIYICGFSYLGCFPGLLALNSDGTQKWAFAAEGTSSSPAIGPDGTIYFGCYDHKLYAVNPNGTQKWAFMTGDEVFSSPAIGSDGTVYVGSGDHNLYAVNPNGTQKWAFVTANPIWSSPAIGTDGTIYVGCCGDRYESVKGPDFFAINPDGTQKWAASILEDMSSPCIGSDGTIYVGANGLFAFNPDGTIKWSYPIGPIWSSPIIGTDGTIYVGSQSNGFYAIGPTTLNVYINLGNYIGDFSLMLVRVNVLDSTGNTVATQTVPAAATTSVTFTNIAYGSYTVQAFAPKWLSQSQTVTLGASGSATVNMTLMDGDLNGDNFVEDQDYSILGLAWYQEGT